ncbi:hypothetical protein IJ670_02455 [bacterium]|nr:hypothetical protein [bacterium]
MKSKNKIFDSFEQFIAQRVSILKNRIIQITGYRCDFMTTKSINLELDDNTIRINCINSEGAYNLISSVIYKRKKLMKQEKDENKKSDVSLEFA